MLIKEFCNTEYNGVAGNMDLHNNTVALTINSKSVSKWMGFRQNSFAQFSISQAVLQWLVEIMPQCLNANLSPYSTMLTRK